MHRHILQFGLIPVTVFLLHMHAVGGENKWSVSPSLVRSLLSYIDYNRVDGTFLGGKLSLLNSRLPRTSLTASAGYGLKSEELRYALSLAHSFDLLRTKTITLTYFDETRSNDRWIVSQLENILSTSIFRKDYRDYFRLRGFETQFTYNYSNNFGVTFDFGLREYGSLPNREPWTLFSKDKEFRENPTVAENDESLFSVTIRYNTREDFYTETNYWQIELVLEREFNDFRFTGVHFLMKRVRLGHGNQTLIAGLQGDFRKGTTAEQYLMDLGGIGSLRGYDFKEFTGSGKLYFECNYLFNGDLLQQLPLQSIPFYSSIAAGIFFEAGLTWFADNDRPGVLPTGSRETGNSLSDIKSDICVSLLILDGAAKIDAARRLDRGKNPWKITFRLRLFQFL